MVDKKRTWIRTSRLLIVLGGVGLLGLAPLLGATQTALTPGDHHLLRVQEVRSHPRDVATSLEWSLVGNRGRKIGGVIPGSGGPEFDAYPALFNDADTGAPILVWSRHNGVDFDLAFTRFDGESWTAPITLVGTAREEIQPQAYSTPGGEFHLVWNWPDDGGNFLYGRFRVDSGVSVIEPERVIGHLGPRVDQQWVSTNPEGGLDDPGTGRSFVCQTGERCPCDYYPGGCGGNIDPSGPEGATVCESLSLVVGSGRNACILTRTADGWSLGACQAFRGGAGARELLLSLGRLQNTACP
jgi:hypothetical protein